MRTTLDDYMDGREKFFKKHRLVCSCRVGYVVCKNCRTYYKSFGKLRLIFDPNAERYVEEGK